ncbi:hypothetical protein [Nocardia sp. NPDC052566]|uniref:hypothetical protein n=1 Tax=Nocardia sp. NPDC052566 TaxID=3364330 RepID=UPI0037C8A7BA
MTFAVHPRLHTVPVLAALSGPVRRLRARMRLTPEERRNLQQARAAQCAIFSASLGGHYTWYR